MTEIHQLEGTSTSLVHHRGHNVILGWEILGSLSSRGQEDVRGMLLCLGNSDTVFPVHREIVILDDTAIFSDIELLNL